MEYVLIFSTPGAPRLAIFEMWVYPTDDTFLVTTQIPPWVHLTHLKLVRRGFPPEETRLRENQASLNVD